MILSCPVCSTRFLIADALFGSAARKVRCGKCRHEWMAQPPVADTPTVAATETAPTASADDFAGDFTSALAKADEQAETPSHIDRVTPAASIAEAPAVDPLPIPPGSNLPVALDDGKTLRRSLFAVVVLMLVSLIGAGAIYGPPILGELKQVLTPAPTSLVIEDVKTHYVEQPSNSEDPAAAPTWALVVEGTIRNPSKGEVKLPPLQLITKDASGKVIGTYTPDVQMQMLTPGGVTGFTHTLKEVSDKLAEVTVQFAGAGS